MTLKVSYQLMAVALTIVFLTRLFVLISVGSIEVEQVIELSNWGALTYMAIAISYLYPQFKDKDERANAIRQKGMYYSMFIVLFIVMILLILIQSNIVALTAIEIIRILISVIIISIWTCWIFLSKKM